MESIVRDMQADNARLKGLVTQRDSQVAHLKEKIALMEQDTSYKLAVWAQFD
jgi:hypothetical protein